MTLNERQDYFGQTVNIASRVQGLATSQSIFATGAGRRRQPDGRSPEAQGADAAMSQNVSLRGIEREVLVYAIP